MKGRGPAVLGPAGLAAGRGGGDGQGLTRPAPRHPSSQRGTDA